ncbi:MAG: TraX family protein, partial [Leptotrichia hongkongensis]
MNKKVIFSKGINSFTLHILAMVFMVADHLWNIFFPNQIWLNVLGRLAFPIFAFML